MDGPRADMTVNGHPFRTRRDTSGKARSEKALAGEDELQDALGVCHRPGCAVNDTACAKTLIGRRALARHAALAGARPRWSHPARFKGVGVSTHTPVGRRRGAPVALRVKTDTLCGSCSSRGTLVSC